MYLSRCKVWFGMALVSLLTACASVDTFSTQVSSFNNWPATAHGGFYAFSQDFSQNLEQKGYAEMIAQEMWATGLRRTNDVKKAQFLVSFETNTETRERIVEEYSEDPMLVPSLGFWGWGPRWGYYNTFNMMYVPHVERYPVRYHIYSLALEIKDKTGAPVYQSKVVAQSDASLHEVMPFLANSVFDDFPRNGVRTIRYDIDKSLQQNAPIRYSEKK
ncbi:DUF4136 domain-containing protein [Pelistega europaea]|uniref:DUF4136 domain-containing protein n=1 Tax=Pelistega europaea TaxID=106147 RepID=A0A7Y4LBZ3_9BURK|nr:DUF4136 domain-containing protein [Pelistega europaea]NOL49746.1 DUF4136 domain-containing protein [Pelistega europaea]